MIRTLIKITVLFTLLAGLYAGTYEYEYHLPAPRIEQVRGYSVLDIEGCAQSGIPGEPLLPKQPVTILLPPGETLRSVEIVKEKLVRYPLMLPLLPAQADRPYSERKAAQGFVKNEAVYGSVKYQRETIRTKVEWFRGAGVLSGAIDPAEYYPLSGNVDVAQKLILRVITEPKTGAAPGMPQRLDLLAGVLQNPEMLGSYPAPSEDPRERLLIVTSNAFAAAF
ncbi:MAG: hypothetical protein JXR21_04280, partial [Candidatus Marinimicrobia bacterium]|nr:hypothetical protein [Candidatus Neomarinimicrobiota bacterium]